jgi:hypothetical protein
MSFRQLSRPALHWLLVICMITTSLAVPAQAAKEAIQTATAAQVAQAMAELPCDMDGKSATHEMPCDCCTPASCDLSACLGNACLPELPRLMAGIAPTAMPLAWAIPAPPSRLIDTPLRPPIG